jgi:hypothetical protein
MGNKVHTAFSIVISDEAMKQPEDVQAVIDYVEGGKIYAPFVVESYDSIGKAKESLHSCIDSLFNTFNKKMEEVNE